MISLNDKNIEITEPAEMDLQGIADYIVKELREPTTALRVVTSIGDAITKLEQTGDHS